MAHIHKVYDTDGHYIIDANTRLLKNASTARVTLVQRDHNSERITFELERFVDGHDMSLCNSVRINYTNKGASESAEGCYLVSDLQVSPDDPSVVVFSWLVSQHSTQYEGPLTFSIRFICSSDGSTVDYAWSTVAYAGLVVSKGLNHDGADDVYVYDSLQAWIDEANNCATLAREAAAEAKAVKESIPEDYATMSNEVTALSKEVRADHFPKIPPIGVVQATGGEGSIAVKKHLNSSGSTIGVNALYDVQPCSYTFTGAALGDYAEVVAAHPCIRVWLCAKQDMQVCVTFSNSASGWDSLNGDIKGYSDTVLSLKANEMQCVEFDYTQEAVQELYADTAYAQGVGVIVSLAGRAASNPIGLYELEWFVTDDFVRDYTSDHASHADIADHALKAAAADTAEEAHIAERANAADIADNVKSVISGDVAPFHHRAGTGLTFQASENLSGGYRIKYAVGENSAMVNVVSTQSLGKVADLRDKKFLVKCINRNQDTATDIVEKWYLAHTNILLQEWGGDKGNFATLKGLAESGVCFVSIDYDAHGYADTDDVYLRINNKGSYAAQTPYSLDVEFVVYVVPANYTRDAGIVVATLLDGFDPGEYVRKDEADALLQSEKYITCWGDSLTAMGGWTNTLQALSGLPVYNGGTGGENVRTIAARQGADVMMLNGITIPADVTPLTLATYAQGIPTEFGYEATPLLQGGAHVNPVMLGDIEGTLKWTGSAYNDTTGTWTFTRSKAGEAVTLNRPTAMRTNFDRVRNAPHLMVIYIGQNGGYTDLDDLVRMHRLMIEHSHAENVVVLGFSSGSASQRSEYETRMRKEFGRYFISLREYLAHPIYAADGSTIVSCYGLDDAGLTATDADLAAIATGTVPPQLLADSVHYTTTTRTVIGNMLYKRCCELGIF